MARRLTEEALITRVRAAQAALWARGYVADRKDAQALLKVVASRTP